MSLAAKWKSLDGYCGAGSPGLTPFAEWNDWTDKASTRDQRSIERFLERRDLTGLRILHVGIGNSDFARRFALRVDTIVGLTVNADEKVWGDKSEIPNYRIAVHNKYVAPYPFDGPFDIIVDNNPTTFGCCRHHLMEMMTHYRELVGDHGMILTARIGLAHVMSAEGQDANWGFTFEDWSELAAMLGASAWKGNRDVYGMSCGRPPRAQIIPTMRWLANAITRHVRQRVADYSG